MLVLGSIYSIVLSSGILLKEEYNKTAEFLLAWPLSRSRDLFQQGGSGVPECCSH
jgi:ABC-type transport system involved in multi-copper enzyme maturation permease subunit